MKPIYFLLLFWLLSSCVSVVSVYEKSFFSDSNLIKINEEINKLNLKPEETLIDIGAADGFYACEISKKYPKMNFILEDLSEELFYDKKSTVHSALKSTSHCLTFLEKYTFVKGTQTHIPLPDSSYAQILCRKSFHEMKNKTALVEEIHRILKPGGTITIIDIEPKKKNQKDKYCKNYYIPSREVIKHFKEFKLSDSSSIYYGSYKYYILKFEKEA